MASFNADTIQRRNQRQEDAGTYWRVSGCIKMTMRFKIRRFDTDTVFFPKYRGWYLYYFWYICLPSLWARPKDLLKNVTRHLIWAKVEKTMMEFTAPHLKTVKLDTLFLDDRYRYHRGEFLREGTSERSWYPLKPVRSQWFPTTREHMGL